MTLKAQCKQGKPDDQSALPHMTHPKGNGSEAWYGSANSGYTTVAQNYIDVILISFV